MASGMNLQEMGEMFEEIYKEIEDILLISVDTSAYDIG